MRVSVLYYHCMCAKASALCETDGIYNRIKGPALPLYRHVFKSQWNAIKHSSPTVNQVPAVCLQNITHHIISPEQVNSLNRF